MGDEGKSEIEILGTVIKRLEEIEERFEKLEKKYEERLRKAEANLAILLARAGIS